MTAFERWTLPLVAMLFLSACARPTATPLCEGVPLSGSGHRLEYQRESGSKTYTFRAQQEAVRACLTLTIENQAGTTSWALCDPQGTLRWHGRLTGERLMEDTRQFAAIVGEWTLELVHDDASGFYEIHWMLTR